MAERKVEYRGPQVIGAGLPRTGTTSLKRALHTLGLKPCHHFIDVAREEFPFTEGWMWTKALSLYGGQNKSARQEVLKNILEHGKYEALVDFPASCFVQDLIEMYPEAKVIQSVRSSPEVWKRSVDTTVAPIQNFTLAWIGMWIPNQLLKLRGIRRGLNDWMRKEFGASVYDKDNLRVYAGYNAHIKKIVPPERLLPDFEPAGGWKPLCEFLDLPYPKDANGTVVPYPHLNDAGSMKGRQKRWVRQGLVYWAVALGVGFAGSQAIYLLARMVLARMSAGR